MTRFPQVGPIRRILRMGTPQTPERWWITRLMLVKPMRKILRMGSSCRAPMRRMLRLPMSRILPI